MNAKFETFFVKALYEAKIEELVNTYREKHFSVKKHVQMGEVEFDVVVKQGEKNIAFEIMVLPISKSELSEIDKYHKKAKALGYDFRLITIAKPKKSTIEIAWLEKALLKYFAVHPIDTGSTQYQDIETAIQSISITGSQARVCLDGNLSVMDHSGHNSEMLPFQGKLSLNLSEHKIKDADLKVDNHYWYDRASQQA
ncbi:hypothetical protein PN36_00600 [Candidatus Thiomargarita nelsonii]|uniref:Uncharacterized protein n=1 Tax=Candidatus Thiomargarita nelsonii TaxID=1003181 RepID=A0A0A6RV69_9GAMM|nr:hypothetical protein PN36_00600 [Candidatus Thiomargarita nelsonii]